MYIQLAAISLPILNTENCIEIGRRVTKSQQLITKRDNETV